MSYSGFFNLQEVEGSKLLKALWVAVCISFFITFYNWINSSSVSIYSYLSNSNLCPPYLWECGKYYFFDDLPYGYSAGYFYVTMFMILFASIYHIFKNKIATAHLLLLIPFVWKIIWIFFFTYGAHGNYDYYDLALAFILLFLPYKMYFSQVTFIWFYFLASTIKIDDGWILGNYFKTLITGAPLISEKFTPYLTNLVVIMQMLGAWFLFSNNKILQRIVFLYFLAFHIYSGFIVNFRYITISIPALVILFGNLKLFEKTNFEVLPISKKTIIGYTFLAVLFFGQMIGIWIPGDQKRTLEGNYWGLFMFEAAHQCKSSVKVFNPENHEELLKEINTKSNIANNRCDPYFDFYKIKRNFCAHASNPKVSWSFDHSVNGHPFERIVNEENICEKEYQTFQHNEWIKIGSQAEVLDTPVYRIGYLQGVDEIKYNFPASPNKNDYLLNLLTQFYKYLWVTTLLVIISILIYKTFRIRN